MPSTYVLSGDPDSNVYTMVVHTATPVGNNSAGFAWSACLVSAGLNKTMLTVGTGPAQISQADADAIAAGTMAEGSFVYCDDPSLTNPQRNAAIAAQAVKCINDLKSSIAGSLKWYGQTISTS